MRQKRVNGMLRHLMRHANKYLVMEICRMEINVGPTRKRGRPDSDSDSDSLYFAH